MATVNINEILGSDSISGSRVTINSNFLTLQNWINGYITVFGVDSVNGILDLTSSSTGRVAAKIGRFNSVSVPAVGTAVASIDSLGNSTFASIQTTTFTASGAVSLNGAISFGTGSGFVAGGTASFNAPTTFNGTLSLGPAGHVISQNSIVQTGATSGTAFPPNTAGGGGINTAYASPYAVTGLEDVVYANCAGPTGFYMKVVDGIAPVGGTLPNIAQGSRLTIINTSGETGYIWTGITGASSYYTGFNTDSSYGGYSGSGLVVNGNKSYRSALTLQWEPRVGQGQANQNGSWVVLSATNISV